jgi:acetyl esterase/lipase
MRERWTPLERGTARIAAILALGAVTLAGASPEARGQAPMSWPEFRSLASVEADHRVAYGSGPYAFGELYLPEAAGPHPLAIVVHGGCWQSIADVSYMSRFSRFLAESGWAVWAPEFRRIDQPDAGWPAILEDVAAATDHLRSIALDFDLDLDRVVSLGHSSGGHLALWLAARSTLPRDAESGFDLRGDHPLPIRAVVGLAAIASLEEFDGRPERGCGGDVVSRLLGGEVEALDARMRLTSPLRGLPLGVPQLMVAGALDSTVPTAHGEAWVRAATEAGDPAELLEVEGAGHFELVAPSHPSFRSMWPAVRWFLDSAVEVEGGVPGR